MIVPAMYYLSLRHTQPVQSWKRVVACQWHQTKEELSCLLFFNKFVSRAAKSCPSADWLSFPFNYVFMTFPFVCFKRSQAESIKKELSSFKIPSQSLPWWDCLAPFKKKFDVWCVTNVSWNLCHRSSHALLLLLFIATYQGYIIHVLFLIKLICMFLCMFASPSRDFWHDRNGASFLLGCYH